MPSQTEKREAFKAKQAEELAAVREAGLEGAQPLSKEANEAITARIPPIARDEASLVPEQEESKVDEKLLQPDLTNTSMADLEREYIAEHGTVSVTHGSGKKNAESSKLDTAADVRTVEGLSDEQIKSSGLLKGDHPVIHPARIAPDSERPRTPLQKAPAAGPGSWPVPEDALPAAMPSDPPVADRDELSDKTFSGVSGITVRKSGELDVRSTRSGTSITIPRKSVSAAAALWLQLRQQHPQFTHEQLQDEFYLQLEGMIGAKYSDKPGAEASPHGQTAAGDDRTSDAKAGTLRGGDEQSKLLEKSEEQLHSIAKSEETPDVTADDDKAEIVDKILRHRQAKADAPKSDNE